KHGARGLVTGTASLVGGAASGVFGAAANITSSAGSGLASLLDREYQEKRHAAMRGGGKGRQGAVSGIKVGASELADGLSGLIMDPVRGAREGGVKGFFTGVGKGLVGVVVKSTVGVVDMTSSALFGIRAGVGGDDH